MQDLVVSRSDSTLCRFLGDKIEVVAGSDLIIDDAPWLRIIEVASVELSTHSLVGDHVDQLNRFTTGLNRLLELSDFYTLDHLFLAIACPIPEYYNHCWIDVAIHQSKLSDGFFSKGFEAG